MAQVEGSVIADVTSEMVKRIDRGDEIRASVEDERARRGFASDGIMNHQIRDADRDSVWAVSGRLDS